jgi:hypothetical protein
MTEKLIRSDIPLHAGQKINLVVTTYYTIDVDEWLDGEESVTAEQIALDLSGGKYESASAMALAARRGGVGDPTDDEAYLTATGEYGEARFETRYESERREANQRQYDIEYIEMPSLDRT